MSESVRSSKSLPNQSGSDVRARTSATQGDEMELEPLQAGQGEKQINRPRYHRRAMFVLCLYVPLIVIPWSLTCVMSKRPLAASAYYNQHGFEMDEIDRIENWVLAVSVLNSIASLITIPVLSTLVAQAVAVYSHKHLADADYHLEYLIAFANRCWTEPLALGKTLKWPNRGRNGARNLLLFAAVAVVIGSIQQPLYQILVPTESILVPTCQDTNYMAYAYNESRYRTRCRKTAFPPRVVGWDMEPTQMRITNQEDIFQEVLSELAIASLNDLKPHLWNDTHNTDVKQVALRNLWNNTFVASIEQGISTGVLKQHIMRLNSSVSCEKIDRSAFPSPCPGEKPFERTFSHDGNFTRICVPGKLGTSPWTLSRSRQDIQEEMFLDILEECEIGVPRLVGFRNLTSQYTLRCTASTTRGYFELGHYRNNQTWGPLLATWPSRKQMVLDYNDFIEHNVFPSEIADEPSVNDQIDYVPGPLTMASIALFGNNTFFDIATQAWNTSLSDDSAMMFSGERMCNLVPFARLDPLEPEQNTNNKSGERRFPGCKISTQSLSYPDFSARQFLSKWLHGFNDTDTSSTAMRTAVFLVNQAVLTTDKWDSRWSPDSYLRKNYGRNIYYGYGTTVRKPQLSVGVIIGMSCILMLELLCLGVLAWLIYRGPSETATLDVMAFTRLKERMEEEKSPLT